MKSHIVGSPSRPVGEKREDRQRRLAMARGIRNARKNPSNKKEPEEAKPASILKSLG